MEPVRPYQPRLQLPPPLPVAAAGIATAEQPLPAVPPAQPAIAHTQSSVRADLDWVEPPPLLVAAASPVDDLRSSLVVADSVKRRKRPDCLVIVIGRSRVLLVRYQPFAVAASVGCAAVAVTTPGWWAAPASPAAELDPSSIADRPETVNRSDRHPHRLQLLRKRSELPAVPPARLRAMRPAPYHPPTHNTSYKSDINRQYLKSVQSKWNGKIMPFEFDFRDRECE